MHAGISEGNRGSGWDAARGARVALACASPGAALGDEQSRPTCNQCRTSLSPSTPATRSSSTRDRRSGVASGAGARVPWCKWKVSAAPSGPSSCVCTNLHGRAAGRVVKACQEG